MIWLTFQDRCNEEFTNIDGIRRIPMSRQLSIRFSQQRKLTLSRNTTNRWRSATQKVRVRKAMLSFALCTITASRLVLVLDGFISLFDKFCVCVYKAWRILQNFFSLPSLIVVDSWLLLLMEHGKCAMPAFIKGFS